MFRRKRRLGHWWMCPCSRLHTPDVRAPIGADVASVITLDYSAEPSLAVTVWFQFIGLYNSCSPSWQLWGKLRDSCYSTQHWRSIKCSMWNFARRYMHHVTSYDRFDSPNILKIFTYWCRQWRSPFIKLQLSPADPAPLYLTCNTTVTAVIHSPPQKAASWVDTSVRGRLWFALLKADAQWCVNGATRVCSGATWWECEVGTQYIKTRYFY
jgi:hypothetical protein